MQDDLKPIEDNSVIPPEHADTIANVPRIARPAPRTTAQYLREIAKTGNPLAWFLMRLWEPSFEFDPNYVPKGGDAGPLLQEPIKYGLKHYRIGELHLDTGECVTAWYKAAKTGYPTLVYCHGNAGSLDFRASILKEITDRGFGIIIAAYPGFKGHRSHPKVDPSEAGCNATGHAMVRYLVNTMEVPMDNIVLFGESLGGAVALRTAYNIEQGNPDRGHEPQKAAAAVCFNTFTSLVKRAREQFPMLPADILMENRFESDKIISKIEAPILLMHGKADEYTSYHHSEELHKASGGKATLELLDGVTHIATYPGTEEKDPEQIRHAIDCMQRYLSGLHLCLPPPVRDEIPHKDAPQVQWEKIVAKPEPKPNTPDQLGR